MNEVNIKLIVVKPTTKRVVKGMGNIARFFANRICGKHNQDECLMIVGAKGSGKSNAAIYIAERVALYVAEIKGGVPEDYFTYENIGIITREEIVRVMQMRKQYSIYILDDIGVGWNSRNYMQKINKVLNDILQVFRTNNNMLILTLPDSFLIDKVPRRLINHYAEMHQQLYDQGLSIMKLFNVEPKPRFGDAHHTFPVTSQNGKIMRYVIRRASEKNIAEYEVRRSAIAKKMQDEKLAELIASDDDEEKVDKPPKITLSQIKKELQRDKAAGVYKDLTYKEICNLPNSPLSYEQYCSTH